MAHTGKYTLRPERIPTPRRTLAFLGTLALVLPVFAAPNLKRDVNRLLRADRAFRALMQNPGQGIPREILERAACIAILPGSNHFVAGLGDFSSRGLASCRNGDAWGAPVFIQIGGRWSLQFGRQSTDVVMIFKDRKSLEHLLGNKVKIGEGANAVAGPIGRHAPAADTFTDAGILIYSRSHGVVAGMSLNGDALQLDTSSNDAMYGARSWRSVLAGPPAAAPAAVRPFLSTLDQYAHR